MFGRKHVIFGRMRLVQQHKHFQNRHLRSDTRPGKLAIKCSMWKVRMPCIVSSRLGLLQYM